MLLEVLPMSALAAEGNLVGGSTPVPNYYALIFDSMGGSKIDTLTLREGTEVILDQVPTYGGRTFLGWYRNKALTSGPWTEITMRDNVTFYAKWSNTMVVEPEEGSFQPHLNREEHFAYIQGKPDGTFGPEENITRAEFCVMFAELLLEKMNPEATYPTAYSDVPEDAWYANAVGFLHMGGIISGYPDGTFRPHAHITYAEFAAMVSRFDELVKGDTDYPDVPADHWAKAYIDSITARGWIRLFPDDLFRPEEEVYRAIAVETANLMLERQMDERFVTMHEDEIKTFSDVPNTSWAYRHVVEAANAHEFGLYPYTETPTERWEKLL